MFSKLTLVLGVAVAYGSNLTLTPNNGVRYDFIDYESPTYRLGDYDITEITHINSGGGQVRYNRIQAIIPRVVFDTLAEYENVFISMPLYDYNSAVNLSMRIDYYVDGQLDYAVLYGMENISLSMTMLKSFPYTMVDLPNNFNVFDSYHWESSYGQEVRLTFVVPYTPYSNPPSDYAEHLKNITLFTKRGDGYSGGYDDGYFDGVNDGYDNGYSDGVNDGYENGYQVGFSDAETVGDGSWLGGLVFGTIGGIVGFLFALSDFEVLGVSIMSIITLFVAIGILKLLIKVIK